MIGAPGNDGEQTKGPRGPARVVLAMLVSIILIMPVHASEPATATESQSVAVPSYFYPDSGSPGSLWDSLGSSYPAARIAVINPNSGPGDARNPDYTRQTRESRAAGLAVLGYVHTSYGARDLELVKAEIDRYYEWYGVDGIFLDEASTNCDLVPTYYAPLYDHIKSRGGTVVHNPGTHPERECHMSVADVLVTFEGSYEAYTTGYSAPAWISDYPPERFWHLVYATPTEAGMREAVRLSRERNAGWIYVTPDDLPNPWDTLPPDAYWSAELSAVTGQADTTPPVVSAPSESFIRFSRLDTGPEPVPVRLSWSGADAGSGIARYELEHGENGGSFSAIALPEPKATSATVRLAPGTHLFRVRAVDNAGNQGEWVAGPAFTLAVYQEDENVSYPAGTWKRQPVSWAYGGALRHDDGPPSRARFVFTGREIAWVTSEGRNRGRAEVWVDGERTATVDLYSDPGVPREVAFHMDFGRRGTHTIEVRPLGTKNAASSGTRVDVDAFLLIY